MRKLLIIISALFLSIPVCTKAQNLFPDSGYVGIGTTSPRALLDIRPTGEDSGTMVFGRLSEGNTSGKGTLLGVETQAGHPDVSFFLYHSFYGNDNAGIEFWKVSGSGPSLTGGHMAFSSRFGITGEVIWMNADGNIGIGTSTPDAELSVAGTITTKGITMSDYGWPDYVFDTGYQRMPLQAVAQYVAQNAHLPEIPDAGTIEKNGLDVGTMQKSLLKKIEELTLDMIEINKENAALKQETAQLNKALKELTH